MCDFKKGCETRYECENVDSDFLGAQYVKRISQGGRAIHFNINIDNLKL
jgi:hypothetical protein